MSSFLIQLITITVEVLTWLVFIDVILSFFMHPFHPIRETLDRMVEPLLAPIRRVLPPMGGLDFSPIVFFLLLRIIGNLLVNILI